MNFWADGTCPYHLHNNVISNKNDFPTKKAKHSFWNHSCEMTGAQLVCDVLYNLNYPVWVIQKNNWDMI